MRGVECSFNGRPERAAGDNVLFGRNHYEDSLTGSPSGDLDQRHTLNVNAFYRLSDRSA
jgi:hypothetical protein